MERLVNILHNKAKFIEEQCNDVIDLRRKKKAEVIALLKARNYAIVEEDDEYKYLRTMRMEQVEEENIQKLRKERDIKRAELKLLREKTVEMIWNEELKTLSSAYKKYKSSRLARQQGTTKKKIKRKKVKVVKN